MFSLALVCLLVELCKTTGLNFTELGVKKLFDCGDNRNHKHVVLGLGVGWGYHVGYVVG